MRFENEALFKNLVSKYGVNLFLGMSKRQSNKTEKNKTDFSNTDRILSVVCQNHTTKDWMG
jgi:hypothetical protein